MRSYWQLSWVVLALAVALLLLPWALTAGALRHAPTVLTVCRYRVLTGRPCPICGLTRGMRAAQTGSLREANAWHPLALPLTALALLEVFFRLGILANRRRIIPQRALLIGDAGIHLLLFAAVMLYLALSFAGVIPAPQRLADTAIARGAGLPVVLVPAVVLPINPSTEVKL